MAGEHACNNYREHLSAYLDGDLTSSERTELLQHLSGCAECRTLLEQYRTVGSRIRGLPPVIVPESLTAAVYMHTVDAPPRRLRTITNRMAYPAAAIAAVLLVFVVAAFLLIDGYQRRIDPTVIGSTPANGVMWRTSDPIRISFNKEMNKASVEAALAIVPTSERDRLELTWDGNTLVIGQNRLLKPGTTYSVRITTEARDKWGNRLTENFSLGFTTSMDVATTDATVPPTATPSPTAPAEENRQPVVPTATEGNPSPSPAVTSTPEPAGEIDEGQQEQVERPTRPNNQQGSVDPTNQEQPPTATSTPEPEPTVPPATATPEPEPTQEPTPTTPVEEPTATPPPPTATPTVEPTPVVPTATPTQEPEPTPTTPDTVGVAGSFGNVYWRNETVRQHLGEPTGPSSIISVQELDFQHGKMLQNSANGQVFLMGVNLRWEFMYHASGDTLPEFVEVDDSGLWQPGGVFGDIWANDPIIADMLGYAVAGQIYAYESEIQYFEGGQMIYSGDGYIYVLYDDGTWELYPDAGPLVDDSSG